MQETQHYHEEQWADQAVILKWRKGVSPPAPQKMTRLAPGPRRQQRCCTKCTSGIVNSGRDASRGTLHTGLRNQSAAQAVRDPETAPREGHSAGGRGRTLNLETRNSLNRANHVFLCNSSTCYVSFCSSAHHVAVITSLHTYLLHWPLSHRQAGTDSNLSFHPLTQVQRLAQSGAINLLFLEWAASRAYSQKPICLD